MEKGVRRVVSGLSAVALALVMTGCGRSRGLTPVPVPSLTPQPQPTSKATLQGLKLVDRVEAAPGDELFYTLVVMNDMLNGDDPGAWVTLVDTLPSQLGFVEGSLSGGASYDPSTHTITWQGQVPPGGSIQVGYRARLGQAASSLKSVVNTAQFTDALGRRSTVSARTEISLASPTTTSASIVSTPRATETRAATVVASATKAALPGRSVPYMRSLVVTPSETPTYYLVAGDTLYRSTDRGSTWHAEALHGIPGGSQLWFAAVDYGHPQTMYVGTSSGLYRQEAQDQSWSLVNIIQTTALAVDLDNPDVLWAGTPWDTALRAAIVKSSDRGRTWGKADYGLGLGEGGSWVGAILINPRNPNVMWAHVRPGTRHGWPRGLVFRGGRDGSWEELPLGSFEESGTGQNQDVCFVSGLAYDPNLNALYAGCDISYFNRYNRPYRLLRSLNADAARSAEVKWEVVAELGNAGSGAVGISSVRPLAVDARDPRSLFVFLEMPGPSEGGLYRLFISHDDGRTWRDQALTGLVSE